MCAVEGRWEVGAVPNVLTGYIHCFYSTSSSSDPGKGERGRRKGGGRGGEREDGWGMREGGGEWNEKCKNETELRKDAQGQKTIVQLHNLLDL